MGGGVNQGGRVPDWFGQPPLCDVDPTGRALLAEAAQSRSWAAGAVIFQRGDPGDYLLALTEGQVRLSLTTPQGQELTLRHAGPGEVLGELAVVDAQPRSADATAVGRVSAMVLTRAAFQAAAAAHPQINQAMLRYLAGVVRLTNDRLESIALYRLEARVARFLLGELVRAMGPDLPPKADLRLALGQGELALMLGASRPKVNRALQKLTEAGAIQRDGVHLRCDIPALQALADPG